MAAEFEQNIGERRFRNGESPGRPGGGNVADDPFAKALYEIAEFRGLATQTALSVALGHGRTGQGVVNRWYRAVRVPCPAEFGNILVILDPPEPCRERLVAAYADKVMQGRGSPGHYRHNAEQAFELSKKLIKTPADEVGTWTVDFCKERKMSLRLFFRGVGLARHGVYNRFSLHAILVILDNVQTAFGTGDERMESLRSAVAKKIEREKPVRGTSLGVLLLVVD